MNITRLLNKDGANDDDEHSEPQAKTQLPSPIQMQMQPQPSTYELQPPDRQGVPPAPFSTALHSSSSSSYMVPSYQPWATRPTSMVANRILPPPRPPQLPSQQPYTVSNPPPASKIVPFPLVVSPTPPPMYGAPPGAPSGRSGPPSHSGPGSGSGSGHPSLSYLSLSQPQPSPMQMSQSHPHPGTAAAISVSGLPPAPTAPPFVLSNWTPSVQKNTVKRRRSSESPKPSSYMFVPAEFQRRQHRSKSESKVYSKHTAHDVKDQDIGNDEDEDSNVEDEIEQLTGPDICRPSLPMETSGASTSSNTPTTTTRPKRSKAKNSTWTIEEDRQLIDLILNTLPVQDYAEYARILNKRDAQTIRYRWRVILRRARGEGP